jgi:RNA polymerase sigma factor (TIGR02999 family)
METSPTKSLTRLLRQWSEGDEEAVAEIMPLVYDELHRIAACHLRRERPDHTLQATALVHEAYLRLRDENGIRWEDRGHFLRLTSHVMRRILVDYARERSAVKRGGDQERVTLAEAMELADGPPPHLVAVGDAIEALAALDAQKASIVELRYFGGLTLEEIAEAVGISRPTVVREWRRARAWLYRELKGDLRGES